MAASEGKGDDLKISKTQMQKITARHGGNLFSTALSLARPLLAPAAKALATAGLSFGAEKLLKKNLWKGFWPPGGAALQTHADALSGPEKGS